MRGSGLCSAVKVRTSCMLGVLDGRTMHRVSVYTPGVANNVVRKLSNEVFNRMDA